MNYSQYCRTCGAPASSLIPCGCNPLAMTEPPARETFSQFSARKHKAYGNAMVLLAVKGPKDEQTGLTANTAWVCQNDGERHELRGV